MIYKKDKALIAKRFGRCAPQYESVTPVQKQMAERLLSLSKRRFKNRPPNSILELGCGCGRLTRKLRETWPRAEITAIDLAPEMVEVAAASVKGPTFVVADAETFWKTNDQKFDLIISNATAQWFETPEETLKAYERQLNTFGVLAVATFSNGTFSELREAFAAAYKSIGEPPSEHIHQLPGKPYWANVFPVAHYEEEHIRQEFPDVRTFLQSIQRAGATLSPQQRTTLSPSLYRAMTKYYKEHFCTELSSNIVATYHAFYMLLIR